MRNLSGNWLCPLACCLASCVVASPACATGIDWNTDYNKARAIAKAAGRPVVVLVTTPGCGSCRKLTDTFADDGVAVAFEGFVAIRLDAKENSRFAEALSIDSYPVTIFAAPDGMIVHSVSGVVDAKSLRTHGNLALTRIRSEKETSIQASKRMESPQDRQSPRVSSPSSTAFAPNDPPRWNTAAQAPILLAPFPSLYSTPSYWGGASITPSYNYPSYSAPRRC